MPRQNDALRQRLADQDQPLRRKALQADRTARGNLVLPFRGQLDDGDFLVAPRKLPRHAVVQAAKEFLLFQRIQPDQDHHAITEEYSDAVFIDAKRQRRRCQHVAALEARRIEAIADKKRPRRRSGPAERRFGGLVHELRIPAEIAI